MPKRSLMLAGGGIKIAFQAGVLQVWLDEAGIQFDRADAVSAACFNLAMWVQGMSGTQIADNWRNTQPFTEVDINASQLAKLLYAASIFDLNAFRDKVFPSWGLDISKIRSSPREATFNVYNFSKHELRPVPPAEMTEDLLTATGSLPMWFPPVYTEGDTYIDAVFNTGSNIDEAIRAGADELWVIFTTSERGEWFDGFVGNFFGIFEASVVWNYKRDLARIAANNDALKRGEPGEFGRPIVVKELKAEVPLHYLFNFNRDRAAETVNRGVEMARKWCDDAGIRRRPGPVYTPVTIIQQTQVQFKTKRKGFVGDPRVSLALELNIHIADLDQFLDLPEHAAACTGSVDCDLLGGKRDVEQGSARLLVDSGDPTRKEIIYELIVRDESSVAVTVSATQTLDGRPRDGAWDDSETARVTLSRATGILAEGTIKSGFIETMELLASIRVTASSLRERLDALTRFGAFYFGHLWDVYARHVLPVAPF